MDSKETDNWGETSEIFYDYFVKIGESIVKKAKTMNDNAYFKTFLNSFVSRSTVLKLPQPIETFNIINSLNVKKAVGCDNISSFFLRMEEKILASVLSLYFGQAFGLGLFPKIFKTTEVIPIFKSGINKIHKTIVPAFRFFPVCQKFLKNSSKTD